MQSDSSDRELSTSARLNRRDTAIGVVLGLILFFSFSSLGNCSGTGADTSTSTSPALSFSTVPSWSTSRSEASVATGNPHAQDPAQAAVSPVAQSDGQSTNRERSLLEFLKANTPPLQTKADGNAELWKTAKSSTREFLEYEYVYLQRENAELRSTLQALGGDVTAPQIRAVTSMNERVPPVGRAAATASVNSATAPAPRSTPTSLDEPQRAAAAMVVAGPAATTRTSSAPPKSTAQLPTARPAATAENGSYFGQPNSNGVPKTVAVRGYFRSDGTYVQGHYRSPPGSNPPRSRSGGHK